MKYVDPDFETDGVDEDDFEYIYCEDFFSSGYAEDCIANSIFDYDYDFDEGIAKFEFEVTDKELIEYGEDCDGSAEVWMFMKELKSLQKSLV